MFLKSKEVSLLCVETYRHTDSSLLWSLVVLAFLGQETEPSHFMSELTSAFLFFNSLVLLFGTLLLLATSSLMCPPAAHRLPFRFSSTHLFPPPAVGLCCFLLRGSWPFSWMREHKTKSSCNVPSVTYKQDRKLWSFRLFMYLCYTKRAKTIFNIQNVKCVNKTNRRLRALTVFLVACFQLMVLCSHWMQSHSWAELQTWLRALCHSLIPGVTCLLLYRNRKETFCKFYFRAGQGGGGCEN